MRCDRCVLDPGGPPLAVDAFLEQIATCTECPRLREPPTEDLVRVLVQRHRDAARLVRKQSSKVRQLDAEITDLSREMQRYDARMAKLESLHHTSTRELQEQVEIARQQETALRAMSAPIIRVWRGVLALPVIGKLDRERAELMLASLLNEIQERGSSHAIIDLTGVGEIDEATADHLLRMSRAAQLLGAQVILTGVQGRVAQAMVDLGVDLSEVTSMGNVEDALQHCMRQRRAASSG